MRKQQASQVVGRAMPRLLQSCNLSFAALRVRVSGAYESHKLDNTACRCKNRVPLQWQARGIHRRHHAGADLQQCCPRRQLTCVGIHHRQHRMGARRRTTRPLPFRGCRRLTARLKRATRQLVAEQSQKHWHIPLPKQLAAPQKPAQTAKHWSAVERVEMSQPWVQLVVLPMPVLVLE